MPTKCSSHWWCFGSRLPPSPTYSPSTPSVIVNPNPPSSVVNLNTPSSSTSASHNIVSDQLTPDEQNFIDRCVDKLVEEITNKLNEIKGLRPKASRRDDVEVSPFSLEFWKIRTGGWDDMNEILNEGESCVDSLAKYIPKHGGDKDMTHTIVPILEGIGSYHWITSALFLVGKTLERWEQVTENKEECFRLLEQMVGLAILLKQIRDRKMENPNMDTVVKGATEKILHGYLVCCSKMQTSRLRRMLVATYDKVNLSELRHDIKTIYREIASHMQISIYDAVKGKEIDPKNAIPENTAVVVFDENVQKIIEMFKVSDDNATEVVSILGATQYVVCNQGITTMRGKLQLSSEIIKNKQAGEAFPLSELTKESPIAFSNIASSAGEFMNTKTYIRYSSVMFLLSPGDADHHFHDAKYIVAFHVDNMVKMVATISEADAITVYDKLGDVYAKLLMSTETRFVTASQGFPRSVNECTNTLNIWSMGQPGQVVSSNNMEFENFLLSESVVQSVELGSGQKFIRIAPSVLMLTPYTTDEFKNANFILTM